METWLLPMRPLRERLKWDMMLRRATIDFLGSVTDGDLLDIDLAVRHWGRTSWTLGYRGTHEGRLVFTGEIPLRERARAGVHEDGDAGRDPRLHGAGDGPGGRRPRVTRSAEAGWNRGAHLKPALDPRPLPRSVLRPSGTPRGASAAQQDPGPRQPSRPDRRGRGVRGRDRPVEPRPPRHDEPQPDDVRTAGPPLRLLHLRHAPLRQRRLRRGGRLLGRAAPCADPARRRRHHAAAPATRPAAAAPPGRSAPSTSAPAPPRLCQAFGLDRRDDGADLVPAADAGAAPVRARLPVFIADDGTPPPERPARSGRIGVSKAPNRPWRFYVGGDPNVSRSRAVAIVNRPGTGAD